MASLSKAKLVDRLHEYGLGYTKEELYTFVLDFFELMEQELCKGEDIRLARFGTFEVVDKVARPGRNPKTKEEVVIARRVGVRFQASPILTANLNNGDSDA